MEMTTLGATARPNRADWGDSTTTYAIREAVALFPDEARLENAILALQEDGVDRSRISVLGSLAPEAKHGQSRNWMRHLVDLGSASQGAPTDRATLAEAETAVIALPGYGGALAGLIAVMASGGALGIAVASAIFAGAIGSGAGYLIARSIGRHHEDQIASQLEVGGLLLWVRLDRDDDAILDILTAGGGRHVHTSEREGRWGIADIPFATAQPDLFLR